MNDHELIGLLDTYRSSAIDWHTLSDNVKRAQDYYEGTMDDLAPIKDMSSAVSRDVLEAVETVLPDLVDIFLSDDVAVEFRPVGEEDEEAAAQQTDAVNYAMTVENNGFTLYYDYFKDALIGGIGIFKTWWDDTETVERERMQGISDDELAVLLSEDGVEIVEQASRTEELLADGVPVAVTVHDVTVDRTRNQGRVRVEGVPIHEFIIAPDAKTVQTASYCAHETMMSRSALLAMGFDAEVVKRLSASAPTSELRGAQRRKSAFTGSRDKSVDTIKVTEHYVRVDMDGDGQSELWMVTTAGRDILQKERIERVPLSIDSPIRVQHQAIGMSLADLVMDVQRIKTHVLRQLLNNVSLLNNQRPVVNIDRATPDTWDDIATVRDGAPIRVKGSPADAISYAGNNDLSPTLLPVLEYADNIRENRTGIVRHAQGIDADTLNNAASTADGLKRLMTAAQKRIRLIARMFAENGIRDLFINIHHLILKFQTEEKTIRIRGKWVPVDPREWQNRFDMRANIGIGTGDKSEQLGLLNVVLERQVQAIQMQGGADGPIVKLDNVYNTLRKMVQMAGFKTPDLFFSDPENAEPQQPKPDPALAKIQSDAEIEKHKIDQNIALKRYQIDQELQLKARQLEAELALKQTLSSVNIGGDPG